MTPRNALAEKQMARKAPYLSVPEVRGEEITPLSQLKRYDLMHLKGCHDGEEELPFGTAVAGFCCSRALGRGTGLRLGATRCRASKWFVRS
jgi:hypothetical protein